MNKKLLTLAVAAALAAPGLASAEAIMYGKLHVSLDYQNIDDVVAPVYNNSASAAVLDSAGNVVNLPAFVAYGPNGAFFVPAFNGAASLGGDWFVRNDGTVIPGAFLPDGTPLDPAIGRNLAGTFRVAPGQLLPGKDFNGWGFSKGANLKGEGRASRIGVKGSEDLGNGLKAVYQIELGINFDTNNNVVNNADTISYRNTFVGLAGDWGTVLAGRHDSPMKISTGKLDLFVDTMADYNGTIGFSDLRFDQTVAYISPNWSGFQFMGAVVPGGGATATGAVNWEDDGIAEGYSLAAIYSNGPFYGSASYESVSTDMLQSTSTSLNPCVPQTVYADAAATIPLWTTTTCAKQGSDWNKWRLGLGLLNWNGFSLTAIYENQENLPGSNAFTSVAYSDNLFPGASDYSWLLAGNAEERELWQIQAGYSFGNWMFKGMYGQSDFSGGNAVLPTLAATSANAGVYQSMYNDFYNGSSDSWALGVDYNFSKRTTAYVLYTATTMDGSDTPVMTTPISDGLGGVAGARTGRDTWDGFSIGLMHSF
jgi:predicted porin